MSHLYTPWNRDPLGGLDKHHHNEELFIVLQGDFHMIIGSAEGGELP